MKQNAVLERPISELIREFSVKPIVYTESSLIDSIRELKNYKPLPSELGERNRYMKILVREWFSQKIREKYDELSPDLFELKREIEVDKKFFERRNGYGSLENKIKIEIPMLVQASINEEEGWKEKAEYRFGGEGHHEDTYEISFSSQLPKIPLEVRKAGKEAVALTYKTYGEALSTDVLNDIMERSPDYAPNPQNAELIVLWKPKPEEIHIETKRIDKDPALVLNWNRSYLVSTWKEPNEEPFMNLITACRLPCLDNFLENPRQK